MVVVDANVLIYAVDRDAAHHRAARTWLDSALDGYQPIGFAWVVLLAFLRLTTRPGLFARPLAVDEALTVIEEWLQRPAATIVDPSARHFALLRGFLAESGTGGNLANDAHLAAIAIEHGASVATFDTDFARFAGVRLTRP